MHPVVKSFRENFVEGRFVIVLTTLFVIGMRVVLYLKSGLPEIKITNDNFLWEPVKHLFEDPLVSFIASSLSVIIISWLLLTINNRYSIIRSRSNLPFTAPLFFLSLHPYSLAMTGNYIAIIFILFSLIPLLESYQKPNSYLYSFRSSILIAVASLFQVYAIVLIPLWWRGEKSMRGPQLHSFIASLFGVFLVYVSLFSVYFVLDDIESFLLPLSNFISFSIPEIPDYTIFEWAAVVFIAVFIVANIILSVNEYARDKVVTLNLMRFTVYLIVFLILLQIVYWRETYFFIILSVTLVSVLCSYFYSKTTSKKHIYLAYSMMFLLMIFYLSHFFPETFLIV
ncbi:MAG: hypothetical protein PHQ67_05190 [Fermentimonas sp.]|jgi:hypothetical protein|nr:hypothetical protein [Fermentimonas sp.]MDD4009190.1 hypothetical protein [Fermentimonas sp.]MDD4697574.1 hypothetical protein [Fermentimonas sp.]